ncbi:MAG: winged helix-turn-helix transcriptional regulator [Dehalococcoidia bacterium]
MARILRNKNLATKFQILVEIAANQPNIQQKLIAAKIGVTSQAVSEYVKELLEEGFVVSEGRSRYMVTREGVDWVLQMAREMSDYSAFVGRAITKATVCAAIAETDISNGQSVGLKMMNGLLYAIEDTGIGARGVAICDAKAGGEVGVANIEGIVEFSYGRITIVKVPGVHRGGSRNVDLEGLKRLVGQGNFVAAIGLESLCALRQIGVTPAYFYGVKEAIVEASYSGISPVVVCVDDQISGLIERLGNESLNYEIQDLGISSGSP